MTVVGVYVFVLGGCDAEVDQGRWLRNWDLTWKEGECYGCMVSLFVLIFE